MKAHTSFRLLVTASMLAFCQVAEGQPASGAQMESVAPASADACPVMPKLGAHHNVELTTDGHIAVSQLVIDLFNKPADISQPKLVQSGRLAIWLPSGGRPRDQWRILIRLNDGTELQQDFNYGEYERNPQFGTKLAELFDFLAAVGKGPIEATESEPRRLLELKGVDAAGVVRRWSVK